MFAKSTIFYSCRSASNFIFLSRAFQSVDISSSDKVFGPEEYDLKAPISNPEKILCVGMNYVDHCTEQNVPVPTEPIIFSKFSSAITDPFGAVVKPDETEVEQNNYIILIEHT